MIEIVKWSETFETADTRKRQRLGWFLCPSGCDSKGFRKLMRDGRDGLEALGFFMALCQSMATLPIATRRTDTFKNSDGSMMEMADILEISRITGRQVADYRQIIGRLVACGWICDHNSLESQQSASHLPVICQSSASFVKGEGEGEGQEEGKGEGEVEQSASAGKSKRYATHQEVIAYAKSQPMGISEDCINAFFDRMEEIGWCDDKGLPLANWQARFRRYATNWHNNASYPNRNQRTATK